MLKFTVKAFEERLFFWTGDSDTTSEQFAARSQSTEMKKGHGKLVEMSPVFYSGLSMGLKWVGLLYDSEPIICSNENRRANYSQLKELNLKTVHKHVGPGTEIGCPGTMAANGSVTVISELQIKNHNRHKMTLV